MKQKKRWLLLAAALAALSSPLATGLQAGLFKIDFAANQNDAEEVVLTDWDVIAAFTFADFPDNVATWKLTDFSSESDNDVTLTILDNVALSEQLGLDPPTGMTGNNPTHEALDVVYDGINVPFVVKDDYLYRAPDTAGSELLFRFANLNPGRYNVTVFEGRTTDNGEYGKVWVDDINGKKEPEEPNTGDISGTDVVDDARVADPQGNPKTVVIDIKAGEFLWYTHMEDNSGGISGMIIRSVTPPADTDGDGLPDFWETKYNLNPADPTDAAKDCNNNGVTNLDEFKAGLDPCDATAPEVLAAAGSPSFDTMKLTFSETLDLAGATNAANYTITPSLAVAGASYRNKVVTLSTAKQAPGTAYTIALKGIKDLSKNEIPANTKATVNSYVTGKEGVLKLSYWGDAAGGDSIAGTAVSDLLSDPRYPGSPGLVLPVYSLNSRDALPDDSRDNYGATIEGYLTPKETAAYNFFLRSDDGSQFWLNTDDTEAKLALIAEEIGCCQAFLEPNADQGAAWHDNGSGMGQTTLAPITLTAGKKYFFRVIYKEGGGGDYAQVAWRKSTDTTAANKLTPIPAEFLSAAVDLPIPPAQTTPPPPPGELTDGLTAYWSFDGDLLDSVKDYDGIAKGKVPVEFVDGKAGFGKALKLSGTNYVEISNSKTNLQFAKGSLSIAGWFRVEAFDKSWQALISKGENLNYRVARRSDAVVEGDPQIAYAGGVGEGAGDVPKVNDGNWHHFVAVTDATTAKFGTALYVDGVIHGVNTNKAVLAAGTASLLIGENPEALNRQWTGELDDIALWNRVLSADEVATLYKGGAGTPLSSLVSGNPANSMTVSRSGNTLTISWSGAGTLQSSPALGATPTWTDVGTANPATISIGTGSTFYRVKY